MILAIRRFITALVAVLLVANSGLAAGPGTTTGELLKIPVGTRAIGMGEAFTAMADDTSAMYWNPAGLSLMHQKEAAFMHSSLIEGVHYEHLAFASPGDTFAWGTNLSYLGYGDIAGYSDTGQPTGNLNVYSFTWNGAISRFVTSSLALGLSGGLVRESLADESASTLAANLGALYFIPTHPFGADYRIGAAVQNLGQGLKFVNERDPLPMRFKFGLAAENLWSKPLSFTTDVTLPNDNDLYVGVGSEYWFKDLIALRLGYAGSNDEGQGLRLGFGLKYGSLLFDYAYAGFGDFGATNRFGLAMRFGQRVRQLNADERAILKEAKSAEKDGAYVPAIMAYNELLDRDPSNDQILRHMIKAHDRMAENMAKTDVAQQAVPVPSPEDAAVAELIPEDGSDSDYAKNTLPGAVQPLADDPLGLNNLPEANALDAAPLNSPSQPITDGGSVSDGNSPALSPADIYGN